MGSWKGRGKQYTEFVRDEYCKMPTNSEQAFPLEAMTGIEHRPQVGGESVTSLHRGPYQVKRVLITTYN